MSSFESSFYSWLSSKATALEGACGAAMQDGMVGLSGPELDAANRSLSNLYADTSSGMALPGGDCDYSLKGIGPLYTGHWHGKRVHDGVSVLLPLRSALSARSLDVIDVGAGTGAALWAWTLIACFARGRGAPLPVHTWTSIDASTDMLAQGDRLWDRLRGVLPQAANVVKRRAPLCGDWRNPPALLAGDVVVGSYVFSRTDSDDPVGTAKAFAGFVNNARASTLAIWTKENKSAVLSELRTKLRLWKDHTPHQMFDCPLQGRMRKCLEVAGKKFAALNLPSDAEWSKRFNWGRAPTDASLLAMAR